MSPTGFRARSREAAAAQDIATAEPKKADYLVRGYLTAYPTTAATTRLSYVFDVFDKGRRRVQRLTDDMPIKGASADPWSIISEPAMQALAQRSASRSRRRADQHAGSGRRLRHRLGGAIRAGGAAVAGRKPARASRRGRPQPPASRSSVWRSALVRRLTCAFRVGAVMSPSYCSGGNAAAMTRPIGTSLGLLRWQA